MLILDYVLECFQPGYHSCHRTVFVQLQNKIGLFSHDVAIEVFNEGIGATTEIGEVYTITAGMCFYQFGCSENLSSQGPVHIGKIAEIDILSVQEIMGDGLDTQFGQILPQPEAQPFIVKVVGSTTHCDPKIVRLQ